MTFKVPSESDFTSFDGAHGFDTWGRIPRDWLCPACKRSKFEILRWTRRRFRRSVGRCEPYMGWLAVLHLHHDHGFLPRFEETLICDQCNMADASAKRQLRLRPHFSFAPSEISRFITASPHGPHRIDYDEASTIFQYLEATQTGP